MTGLTDAQEESTFELIFLALTRTYDTALSAVPIAQRQFIRCLEAAEENRAPGEVTELWSNLIWRCKACLDVSEALRRRLVNMRIKDPIANTNGAGNTRNDRNFWQLCKTFMQSFVDLITEMREAKNLRLLAQDIVIVLRPVHKASREAGKLIDMSPWGYLTDAGAIQTQPPVPYGIGNDIYASHLNGTLGQYQISQTQPQVYQAAASASMTAMAGRSNGSTSTGASPVSVQLPATPLSAALGPAAQATVPSTPANAYTDQFFAGNVFQRAESLLNMPQAANINFLNRR